MEEMSEYKLYCKDCEEITQHIPKLSAVLDNHLVCDTCRVMNPMCVLTKEDGFKKTSAKVRWIEFEDGRGKELHEKAEVGYGLMMSPFNDFFTWRTTLVTEIIEESEGYIKFNTENSTYELRYSEYDFNDEKETEDED